jgi:PAS domain S-box-containing protein
MPVFPRWVKTALVLSAVVLLIGGIWFYQIETRKLKREVFSILETIAQTKVAQITQWRSDILADAAVIMESPFINESVNRFIKTSSSEQARKLRVRFNSMVRHYRYHDILVVDSSGRLRLTLSNHHDPLHQEAREILENAFRFRKPLMTDLHITGRESVPHLDVVIPILDQHERAAGAVLLQYDPRRFLFPLIQSWPVPSRTAESLLFRREGDSILFLNDLRHRKDTALKLQISMNRKDNPAIRAVSESQNVVMGEDYRSVPVLSVLKPIPETNWILEAKIDAEEALSGPRRESFLILALVLGLFMALLAAAGVLWQRETKHLYKARYLAEEGRRESEERYRLLAENIADVIWILDMETGRFTYVSPSVEKLRGYRVDEVMAQDMADALIPASREYLAATVPKRLAAFEQGANLSYTDPIEQPRRDGTTVWTECTTRYGRNRSTGHVEVYGVSRDIGERMAAEKEIGRLNAELEQRVRERTAQLEAVNQELESFSYSVSHDLRAPLRHLNGFVRLLDTHGGAAWDEKSRHYMQVISDSSLKMGRLIDDILSFSRMGRVDMMQSRVSMEGLWETVLQEAAPEWAGRKVSFSKDPLPEVYGDPAMLKTVLANLVLNALKFTSHSSPALIGIGHRTNGTGEEIFYVRDNGVGFNMGYTHKLFGLFQRLHREEEFEGTGLGLANVKRIISRHGGRVWAEGEPGNGATFYFSLPGETASQRS